MNFELSDEQLALRDAARSFARKRMKEIAVFVEADDEPLPLEFRRELGKQGFLGINIDSRYGGLGLGALDALLVLEEFAQVHPAVAFPIFESCVGPVRAIETFGGEELKEKVIPGVCKGDLVVAVAMSEPEAGTALTDLSTRARIIDEKVTITGNKRWCSGAGHADGYLVYCRFNEKPGAAGIGAVYVPKESDGLSFGKREKLMGFRGVSSADMFFDNVTVPAENVVVREGGFGRLMSAFDLERCGNATMSLGIAASALEDALAYVQQRRQFGKPLVDFQAVQLKLADMAMQVEAARLLIHRAASSADRGFPSIRESSMAKCFSNEIARAVVGHAMQLFGGYGYSKEFPIEQKFRDAWGWGIAGGAIDIQKINIASALIGRRFNQRA
jgi:butyryl-CoA dehydrogenase